MTCDGSQFFHNSQSQHDKQKMLDLEKNGITLITIPHWWNGSWSQIKSNIQRARPGESNNDVVLNIHLMRMLEISLRDELPSCEEKLHHESRSRFPKNITLDEVRQSISGNNFFKEINHHSHISFTYDTTNNPMIDFHKIFTDPNSTGDSTQSRTFQLLR